MPKAKSKLSNVVLDEVSFVGKGDNPEAHIVLLKMAPGPVPFVRALSKSFDGNKEDILTKWAKARPQALSKEVAASFFELLQNRQIRDMVWDMVWTLEESVSSIMNDDNITNKSEAIFATVAQFQEAITIITKGENDMPAELKKKLEDAETQIANLTKANEELTTTVSTLEAEKGALAEEVTTLKGTKETEIDKTQLPEAVRKRMDEQDVLLKKQQADIEKMQDEALTSTMVTKAAEVGCAGPNKDIATLLKKAHKFSPELCDGIFTLLKTADARIRKSGLLKEEGQDNESGADAVAQIEAAADDYRKGHPELTKEQAFAHVYKTNATLRKAYNDQMTDNDND